MLFRGVIKGKKCNFDKSESEDVIYHTKCNTEIRKERAIAAQVTENKRKQPILEILTP